MSTRRSSARRSLSPPPCDTRDSARILSASLEFITPLFGGGVRAASGEEQRHQKEPDPITPVRGASLRGQLRHWWRLACCPTEGCSPERMRAREQLIWGWASTSKHPARAWVALYVDARELKACKWPIFKPKTGPGYAYACFPLQPKRGLRKKLEPGTLTDLRGRFTVRLEAQPLEGCYLDRARAAWPGVPDADLPGTIWEEVERTWLAFVTFGGLGARTRRGFGAVRVTDRSAVSLRHAIESLGWEDRIAIRNGPYHDAVSAHDAALAKLRDFRQKVRLGRNPGAHGGVPGRSRWPEPDALRRLTRHHDPKHKPTHPVDARYPRAAFGLPILFQFKDRRDPPTQTLQPGGAERLASPLVLRPVAEPKGKQVHAVALRLPSRESLEEILQALELRDGRQGLSGLLSPAEQGQISPLRTHRSRPSSGPEAVFEPFFNFFKS